MNCLGKTFYLPMSILFHKMWLLLVHESLMFITHLFCFEILVVVQFSHSFKIFTLDNCLFIIFIFDFFFNSSDAFEML